MNAQPILTDADLEAMLRRRAGSEAPVGLADEIALALAELPDGRRPWSSFVAPPDRSAPVLRLAWVVALVGLLLAATVSAIFVGGELLRRANQLSLLPLPPVLPAPSLPVAEGPVATGEPVVMSELPVQINDLAFAPDGTAWAATGLGVLYWDPAGGATTLYDQGDGLPGQRMDRIAVGAEGTVLVAGGDRMAVFDGTWTAAPDLGGVYGLAVGPDGTAWASDSSSLLRYDGSWSRIELPESLSDLGAVVAAADGSVWATALPSSSRPASSSVGVWKGTSWLVYSMEGGATPPELDIAGVGAEGTAWMTLPAQGCRWTASAGVICDTRPGGIARFDGTRWTVYPLAEVLPGQDTSLVVEGLRVAVGPDGTVWATPDRWATRGRSGIVSRFDGEGWIATQVPELATNRLLDVAPDGAAWFGSSDGLVRYDGSAVTRYSLPTIASREIAAEVSPLELELLAGPTATESVMGTITWRVYRAPEGHELGGVTALHGLVAGDGQVLRWLTPDGSWVGTVGPVGDLRPLGDDLVATDGTAAARWSWDGSRWVARDWLDLPAALVSVKDIVAGTQRAVAIGEQGQVAFSADGMHFTMAERPPDGFTGTVLATRDGFVALMASSDCDGPHGCPDGIHEPLVWYSSDGSTWTLTADTSPFGSFEVLDIASRDGRHIAVGTDTEPDGVWVSDDGIRWERVPAPRGMKVAATPGGWVMVDEDAGWWASADGRTWEPLDGLPAFAMDEWPPHLRLPGSLTAGPGYIVVTGALEPAPGGSPDNAIVIGTIEP